MLIHFRNYLGLSMKGNLSLCRENCKGAFYHHLYKGVVVSQSDIHWVKTYQRYSGVTLLDVNYHLKRFTPLFHSSFFKDEWKPGCFQEVISTLLAFSQSGIGTDSYPSYELGDQDQAGIKHKGLSINFPLYYQGY